MHTVVSGLPDTYLPRPVDAHGCFIAVEGVSGSGKSTVVAQLVQTLPAIDLHVMPPAIQRRTGAVNKALRPLPQLAFYLSGLLYASDLVRGYLAEGNVVTDRYSTSVIANHSAVHDLDIEQVLALTAGFLPYLLRPTVTIYLQVSKRRLMERFATKNDITAADRLLLDTVGTLDRVLNYYAALIERDERAVVIDTDDLSADEVVAQIAEHVRIQYGC